jgi:hypothetical protein
VSFDLLGGQLLALGGVGGGDLGRGERPDHCAEAEAAWGGGGGRRRWRRSLGARGAQPERRAAQPGRRA